MALRNKAAYILAVSDIMEPNTAWHDYKYQVTQRHWDYDFRQLYFTWTPDITAVPFSPTLTIASRDDTDGHTFPQDLYLAPDGTAHILYSDTTTKYPYFRDRFFPDAP